MVRKALAAGLAAALVVALGSAAPLKPDPAKAAADPEFVGKIIVVETRDPKRSNFLQNVRVRRLGGREFLVGEFAPREDTPVPFESTYWYPIDQIEVLTEYKNKEEARKAYEAHEKADKSEKN